MSGNDHPSVGSSENVEIDANLFWAIYHCLLVLTFTSILGYSSHRLEQENSKLHRLNKQYDSSNADPQDLRVIAPVSESDQYEYSVYDAEQSSLIKPELEL